MSKELNWSSKRQDQEFEQAKDFLTSMGLHPSLQSTTYDDIKKGNLAQRRSLGEPEGTSQVSDRKDKESRRQIPVERSGGGT